MVNSGYRGRLGSLLAALVSASVLLALAVHAPMLALLALPFALLLVAAHELLRPFARSFRELCLLILRVSDASTRALLRFAFSRDGKARFPRWTLAYEWFQAIAFAAGEHHGGHIIKPGNARAFRRNFDAIGWLLGVASCWLHRTQLERFERHGLQHLWLRRTASRSLFSWSKRSSNVSKRSSRTLVILYYHGGGYALFSPQFFVDFCNRLRHQVVASLGAHQEEVDDVQVLLANYRKLPESTFPAPLDDAMAMFDYLTLDKGVDPSNIVLAGDSAGGGLVLGTLLRLRDSGRQMPLAAVYNCPYVDLSADVGVAPHCFISKAMLDAIRESATREHSGAWREGVMLDRDLSRLPAMLIQAGEFDILHPQSLKLAERAQRHGVDVQLDIHRFMPHVFTLFPPLMLPHSRVGVQRMGAFIAQQRLQSIAKLELPSVVTVLTEEVAGSSQSAAGSERHSPKERLLPPAA
jgi:acetyl esterase/lipase